MKINFYFIYALLIFFVSSENLFGQNPLILIDDVNRYSINEYVFALFDSSKKLTIKEISRDIAESEFKHLKEEQSNLGYRSDVIWLRFIIKNESKKTDWMLSLNSPGIDKAILFTPLPGGRFKKDKAGLIFPRNENGNNSRLIAFQTNLDISETKTYYIRIESEKPIQFNLEAWLPNLFYEEGQNEYMLLGLFYGGLIIMAVYNFFLFYSIRDFSYLLYSIYVIAVLYYQGNIDGIYFQYFTPDMPQYNLISPNISTALVSFFGFLFVKEFLQLKKYSLVLNRISLFLIYVIGIDILFTVILKISNSIFTVPLGVVYIIFSFISGVYCLTKGNKNAVFLLVASSFFFVGISFRVLRIFALIDVSILSEYGMQIGILLEMTILSFALGDRINTIKREEETERALIRSRIASDLHDEIGSNLSSIIVSSQIIKKSPYLNSDEIKLIDETITTAKESTESIRDIIWFINPDHDNREDLISKMKDTAAKLLNGIEYSFVLNDVERIKFTDLKFRKNLFLIYKEILNNIVKHACAKKVFIIFEANSNNLVLSVKDEGIGFDENNISFGEGLKNLKRRAKELNGKIEISSGQSKGTTITLTFRNS